MTLPSAERGEVDAPGGPVVAVVGDAALDLMFDVPTFDGVDEKLTATDGLRDLGGTGANAAAAIARLGGRARLHAPVGTDLIAQLLVRRIEEQGIDSSGVVVVEGRSTLAVILRSPDHRLVVVDRGIADTMVLDPAIVTAGAALLYLSAIPWTSMLNMTSVSTVPTVVGLEARQAGEFIDRASIDATAFALDRAIVVVTNEAGADAFAPIFRRLSKATLVTTRGVKGAELIVAGHEPIQVTAPMVDAIDATGAGDCFAGALCRFLSIGFTLEEAARLATIAASLSTRHAGALAGIPTEAEVLALAEMRF